MKRRNRKLTEDERALWSEVARNATPLHAVRPRFVAGEEQQVPAPEDAGADAERDFMVLKPHGSRREPRTSLTLAAAPGQEALQMDRKAYERLTRGKIAPQSRLDLHGMTLSDAHSSLRGFIMRAHNEGLRLVLVITGKGKPGHADAIIPERHGVLRHQVPHWLRLPPLNGLILQISPAHRKHGGEGAYYIYLRRSRGRG